MRQFGKETEMRLEKNTKSCRGRDKRPTGKRKNEYRQEGPRMNVVLVVFADGKDADKVLLQTSR
jgi:hypothetical protein